MKPRRRTEPIARSKTLPAARPRFAGEREGAIAQLLRETVRVEVSAPAALHQVSADCLRRDLRPLAARGLVQKTHGGAAALHVGAKTMAQRRESIRQLDMGRATAAKVQAHQTLFRRADWAFFGACAAHPGLGLNALHGGDAQSKRAMLECAM